MTTNDITEQIHNLITRKFDSEATLLKKCFEATEYYFDKFIREVELAVDEEKEITHQEVTRVMETYLEKTKPNLKKKFNILDRFYDYSYAPIIQSGGNYSLKIINESDKNKLKPDVIRLALGGKYFEMNCNLIRTLIINPTEDEQKAYTALLSLFNELQNGLKNGQNISQTVNKIVKGFKDKYPELKDNLVEQFGFGMGYEFKEKKLVIQPGNEETI